MLRISKRERGCEWSVKGNVEVRFVEAPSTFEDDIGGEAMEAS